MPNLVSAVTVPGKDVEWLSVPDTLLPDGVEANTQFDGKNLGFAVGNIYIVATDTFLADNPAAAKFFELVKVDLHDISAQNKSMACGRDSSDDIDADVSAWIDVHKADYDSWLEAFRAAVQ